MHDQPVPADPPALKDSWVLQQVRRCNRNLAVVSGIILALVLLIGR